MAASLDSPVQPAGFWLQAYRKTGKVHLLSTVALPVEAWALSAELAPDSTTSPVKGTAGAAVTAVESTIKDGDAGSTAGDAKAGSMKLPKELRMVMVVKVCIAV